MKEIIKSRHKWDETRKIGEINEAKRWFFERSK